MVGRGGRAGRRRTPHPNPQRGQGRRAGGLGEESLRRQTGKCTPPRRRGASSSGMFSIAVEAVKWRFDDVGDDGTTFSDPTSAWGRCGRWGGGLRLMEDVTDAGPPPIEGAERRSASAGEVQMLGGAAEAQHEIPSRGQSRMPIRPPPRQRQGIARPQAAASVRRQSGDT